MSELINKNRRWAFIQYILSLALLMQACIVINENDYRILKPNDFQYIEPFNSDKLNHKYTPGTQILIEIDNTDLAQALRKADFTWVKLWRPFCTSVSCENIATYAGMVEDHPEMSFMLVSETYDIRGIRQKFSEAGFELPVYVLNDSIYGHKLTPARKLFINTLGLDQQITTQFSDDDFLFHGTSLIFSGDDLAIKLDSLMLSVTSTSKNGKP